MPSTPTQPAVSFHFKWVAKVAFLVGVLATIGLLLALFLITDDKGVDYAHVIANHSLTQYHLAPALLVFGLLLVLVAAATTWLVALYSSFRIAGPLFRFAQNLKNLIDNAFALPVAIRQSDWLQMEWQQFNSSQARLREHYTHLHQLLAKLAAAAAGSDRASAWQEAMTQLQEVERRAKL